MGGACLEIANQRVQNKVPGAVKANRFCHYMSWNIIVGKDTAPRIIVNAGVLVVRRGSTQPAGSTDGA